MTTRDDAVKIVALFGQLDSINKRLAEIDATRAKGTQISVSFKMKNPEGNWGDIDGLKYNANFRTGDLNGIAATILGRLSEQAAEQKRKIEHDLAALGARS